jgi:hypothetical protein
LRAATIDHVKGSGDDPPSSGCTLRARRLDLEERHLVPLGG